MRNILFGVLFLSASAAHAQVRPALTDAEAIMQRMSAVGAKCSLSSPGFGYRCQFAVPSYHRPVNVFIALDFRATSPLTELIHFHGWWLDPSTTPFDGQAGDDAKIVAKSGRNVVMIVPESHGRDVDYASGLSTSAQLAAFISEVEAFLVRAGVPLQPTTPMLISGHSGAFVEIGKIGDMVKAKQIPRLDNLKGVALLDAAYGYRPGFLELAKHMCAHSGGVYFLTYNPADGSAGKKSTYERLGAELSALNCPALQTVNLPDPATHHVDFPSVHLADFLARAAE